MKRNISQRVDLVIAMIFVMLLLNHVHAPWWMYPLGLLFSLATAID